MDMHDSRRVTRRTAFEVVIERVGLAGVTIGVALCVLFAALAVLYETEGTLLLELPWPAWAKAAGATVWLLAIAAIAFVARRIRVKGRKDP